VESTLYFIRSIRQLLVTASIVPSSPILVTLMKEALSSSKTSVLTRAAQSNIPKDAILHSHRSEKLKSYMVLGYLIDCLQPFKASERIELVLKITWFHIS
jgi:hypothetical protein